MYWRTSLSVLAQIPSPEYAEASTNQAAMPLTSINGFATYSR
jgi:hypothetical protein